MSHFNVTFCNVKWSSSQVLSDVLKLSKFHCTVLGKQIVLEEKVCVVVYYQKDYLNIIYGPYAIMI